MTKQQGWEKELDKYLIGMDEGGEQCYFIDNKPLNVFIKDFIRKELEQARQDGIEEVEKRVERLFDRFRSSDQKKSGRRIFGVANFETGARDLYNEWKKILSELKNQAIKT